MKKILVAGATGYLGRNVVKALKDRGFWVRALGRNAAKLDPIKEIADELYVGELSNPDALDGLCDGIDIVFSSVGITRQKDGLSYQDVDYQCNRNLLTLAEGSDISKFVYVHVLNAEKLRHVAMIQAKQAFVDDLEQASLAHTVICPTGFFSDMEEFLEMARGGRVYLFGDGSNRINPIHGADLAEICVDAMECPEQQLDVGGPEVFTYSEIANLACDVLEKPRKITRVPKIFINLTVGILRRVAPVKTFGPIQFMGSVMTMDVVGEKHGQHRLVDHFRRCVEAMRHKSAEESTRSPKLTKHQS